MTSTVSFPPITGQLSSVLVDANGFATNSAWSNKYATFGPNTFANPQAAALALGYDVTGNTAGIIALAPGSAWQILTLNCSNLQVRISGGTSKLTVDTTGIGLNGNSTVGKVTGFGTPTGTGVIANFPGATATLAQCSQAIAQLITDLKNLGVYGA